MRRRTFLTLLLSVVFLPAAAAVKKPPGKVSDLAAFSRIHSYCVDSTGLPSDEANDVKNFVRAESKPKKLLTKLPWTLVSDCSQGPPDAVVKVEFLTYTPTNEIQVGKPLPGSDPMEEGFYTIRAVLRVSQGTSSEMVYEIEADPLGNSVAGKTVMPVDEPLPVQRRNATYGAFWMLTQDVQRVSQMSPK